MSYIAPTGFPQDWGLDYTPLNHPQLAYLQPSSSNEPAMLVAINGVTQTAVPLDQRMIARLLIQLSEEAAKHLEGV